MNNPNTIITIFGGTGDLTYRKLLPAFYNLVHGNKFSASSHIVIVGRRDFTTESYREQLRPWIESNSRYSVNDAVFDQFLNHIHYIKITFTEFEGYPHLRDFYSSLDKSDGIVHQHLFYFAVSPSYFVTIANHLNKAGLADEARLIIEKPFGNDLKSSIAINEALEQLFNPENIFRIDHYLAKEMVQNILTLRFENALFESVWNADMIDNIQISATETVGVESRGNFYDTVGALKDMIQSHLLQVLSIVTMEKPLSLDATDLHTMQENALDAFTIRNPQTDIVYGQYTEHKDSKSYINEDNVNSQSKTETFVAFKGYVETPRLHNVPIFVRTGKRMHRRSTEVVVELKSQEHAPRNLIVIKIQPDEGVYVRFNMNKPGTDGEKQTVYLDFCKSCNYVFRQETPEAYERLLNAALNNDHTLFASFKQVVQCWTLVESWIEASQNNPIHDYKAYTDGPQASHDLLKQHHTTWFSEQVLGDVYEIEHNE
ncbi:glucose-6-phosphate dehydrogenase [Erysipelothrix larvae]|uniref:Glucose-6-phosphate 1-dehydrogenase n=1 Tax=Erysipelothrix larvae TaxID=1514105 RepID=A0A120JTJ3_9FIRM|nr:glucose-6-phosphate dehydrogenase [Erysipelothrix larvae]AMC93061.1 glucose-6-phosphate dehydrogenase [Erysipelothrix larvae]